MTKHSFFSKIRTRRSSIRSSNQRCTTGYWNYERTVAEVGTVVVGKSTAPACWARDLEGTRIAAVRVVYHGDEFFLNNQDGSGYYKVFERRGGPNLPHADIPVDDSSTFITDPS